MLIVSQLCDKGNQVIFDKEKCVVKNPNNGNTFITALRHDNVYASNTNETTSQDFKCLKDIMDEPKLWHRRLGHINTDTMHELVCKDLAMGLLVLHIDLCGPMRVRSIRGKSYILVTIDDFFKFTWVDFLKNKGEALKLFSRLCKEMQTL